MVHRSAFLVLLGLLGVALGAPKEAATGACDSSSGNILGFSVKSLDGKNVSLKGFGGGPLLVTNTAAFCGLTVSSFTAINKLLTKYNNKGFKVLAFPCNQFGMQEPEHDNEILNAYKYVRPGNGFELAKGGTVFAKIEANGSKGHPLYTFLKNACPQPMKTIGDPKMLFYDTIKVDDITWNFEKFLLDKQGRPRYRFSPAADYALVEKYLKELLAE